jgi:hypothetical protein
MSGSVMLPGSSVSTVLGEVLQWLRRSSLAERLGAK